VQLDRSPEASTTSSASHPAGPKFCSPGPSPNNITALRRRIRTSFRPNDAALLLPAALSSSAAAPRGSNSVEHVPSRPKVRMVGRRWAISGWANNRTVTFASELLEHQARCGYVCGCVLAPPNASNAAAVTSARVANIGASNTAALAGALAGGSVGPTTGRRLSLPGLLGTGHVAATFACERQQRYGCSIGQGCQP
jgi:hypothetical protein